MKALLKKFSIHTRKSNRRKSNRNLLHRPDKTFTKWRFGGKRLKIRVKIITMPPANRWEAAIVSSKIIIFETNWPIIPAIEGEIIETSFHPLAEEFKKLDLVSFSISEVSGQAVLYIGEKPLVMARKISKILFRWETDVLYKIQREIEFEIYRLRQLWAYVLNMSPRGNNF